MRIVNIKKAFMIIILCFMLSACKDNITKNSNTLQPASLSPTAASQAEETAIIIDYTKEKETLQGLKNKLGEKMKSDNIEAPSILKMLHFDKSYTADGENKVATFYFSDEGNINIISVDDYRTTFYFENDKIYIDIKDDGNYMMIDKNVYSLNSESQADENKQDYLIKLLTDIQKGNFGSSNVAIGSKSYISKEYSEETIYSDFYLIINEVANDIQNDKVILLKKLDGKIAGGLWNIENYEDRYNIPEKTVLSYQNWYGGGGYDYFIVFDEMKNQITIYNRSLSDGNYPIEDLVSDIFPLVQVDMNNPSVALNPDLDEVYLNAILSTNMYYCKYLLGFDDSVKKEDVFLPWPDTTAFNSYALGQITLLEYEYDSVNGYNPIYYVMPKSAKNIKSLKGLEIGDTFDNIEKTLGEGNAIDNRLYYDIDGLRYTFTSIGAGGKTDKLYISFADESKRRMDYFSAYKPIVVNSTLVGGFDGKSWINSDDIFNLIYDKERYNVFSSKNKKDGYWLDGVQIGTKIAAGNEGGGFYGNRVELNTDIKSHTLDFGNDFVLAVSGTVDLRSDDKYVTQLDNSNEIYKKILSQTLIEKGYKDFDLQIKDIYKVDIDKDGVDEIIINADTGLISGADGEKFGSFVFMRKVINGSVENIILNESLLSFDRNTSISQLIVYRILCFCDLNNDGVMEIIVKTNGNDHLGVSIYEMQGNKFVCVLSAVGISA